MLKIYRALCYAKRNLEVALSNKPLSHPSHHLDYEGKNKKNTRPNVLKANTQPELPVKRPMKKRNYHLHVSNLIRFSPFLSFPLPFPFK